MHVCSVEGNKVLFPVRMTILVMLKVHVFPAIVITLKCHSVQFLSICSQHRKLDQMHPGSLVFQVSLCNARAIYCLH